VVQCLEAAAKPPVREVQIFLGRFLGKMSGHAIDLAEQVIARMLGQQILELIPMLFGLIRVVYMFAPTAQSRFDLIS
jgi:hypothetical protein